MTTIHRITVAALLEAPRWATAQTALVLAAHDSSPELGNPEDVTLLPDGRVVVADAPGAQVLVFSRGASASGNPTRWGRKGGGPGEYQFPTWLGRCGARGLEVYDPIMGVRTSLDTDGHVTGTRYMRVQGGGTLGSRLSCNQRGVFVGEGPPQTPRTNRFGPFRPVVPIVLITPSDSLARSVVRVLGADSYRWPEQVGRLGDFARSPQFAMGDSTLFLTTGDSFRIGQFTPSGTLVSLIALTDANARPLADSSIARVVAEQLDRTKPQYRRELRHTFEAMTWPEFFPTVDGLVMDEEGCLWVRFDFVGKAAWDDWHVLTQRGTIVGAIRLVGDIVPRTITSSEILGWVEDRLGKRDVVALRYRRPPDLSCH
ncbi:MAG: hypothetical protein IT359_05425 [Gemmatimonadaceae bacterium]|nr:hypothetical protein [Gemmatimonadaceae bacterium]